MLQLSFFFLSPQQRRVSWWKEDTIWKLRYYRLKYIVVASLTSATLDGPERPRKRRFFLVVTVRTYVKKACIWMPTSARPHQVSKNSPGSSYIDVKRVYRDGRTGRGDERNRVGDNASSTLRPRVKEKQKSIPTFIRNWTIKKQTHANRSSTIAQHNQFWTSIVDKFITRKFNPV